MFVNRAIEQMIMKQTFMSREMGRKIKLKNI